MTRLLTLIALIGITQFLLRSGDGYDIRGGETMLVGFLLLAAYLAGQVAQRLEMPRITGYLLLGTIVGPFVLHVLPREAVTDFRLINGGALSLIALQAGGELRLSAIRARGSSIASILTCQLLVTFVAVLAVVYYGRDLISFLDGAPSRVALAVGLIFGLVAVAKSPATTVAIITEERARGQLTETVLGVTVLKDVVVLMLIAVVIPLAAVVADPGMAFSFSTLDEVLLSIVASVVAGLGIGWILVQYLRRSRETRVVILFATAFLLTSLSEQFGLEYILIAMAAGFYVQNFSRQGRPFLHTLEATAVPVYALFFAVAGADLRIDVLPSVWGIALAIVLVRITALIGSTYIGSRIAGDPMRVPRYAWMGFLAQAGVTLGIANIVRDRLDIWGGDVATVIVAMIAMNQLIGPPAFRFALVRSGESRREGSAEGVPGRAEAVPA